MLFCNSVTNTLFLLPHSTLRGKLILIIDRQNIVDFSKLFICILMLLTPITVRATFVEMGKSHSPDKPSLTCTDTVQFSISLSVLDNNGGNSISIKNLKIRDILPPGLVYIPGSQVATPSASFTDYLNGTLLWDFGAGPFDSYPHASVTFDVSITNGAPENVVQLNIAEAFYRETESNAASNPVVTDSIRIVYPILDIRKACSGMIYEGDDIIYTVTINNTGHLDAEGLIVRDILPSGVIYTPGSATASSGIIDESELPNYLIWTGDIENIDGSHIVTITIPVSDDPNIISDQHLNNATYEEVPECFEVLNYWDSCETPVIHPSIDLEKNCEVSKINEPADITYTYEVTNTGDTALTNVELYDDTLAILILGPVDLAPQEMVSSQYTLFNQPAGPYTNVATATGLDILDNSVSDQDSASCAILEEGIIPDITVGGEIYSAMDYAQRTVMMILIAITSVVYIFRRR